MNRVITALTVVIMALTALAPVQAATSRSVASKQSKAKSPVRKSTKKTSRKRKVNKFCPLKRVKTSKGWRSIRDCNAYNGKLLSSPISSNALEKAPSDGSDVKVRSAPDRAYAVDGESFFYQGRKYRIAGLEGVEISDMARQRLQKQLESGPLEIEALSSDEDGVSAANVRINGSDLAGLLK